MKSSRPSPAPPIGFSNVPFVRNHKTQDTGVVFEIRQNSAVVYGRGARRGVDRTEAQQLTAVENLLTQQQLGSSKGTGYMSRASRSKVMKNVHRLISMASVPAAKKLRDNSTLGYAQQVCYLTFLTLVLPSAQHQRADGLPDDAEFKAMMGRFLEDIQRICGVVHYVWVVEAQQNGNLHAHILIDKFIENLPAGQNKVDSVPLRLTKLWNQRLRLEGYIEPYAEKMRAKYVGGFVLDQDLVERRKRWDGAAWCDVLVAVPEVTQRARYAYGVSTDWQEPNTVDIHALGKAENVAGYIAAYMTKSDSVRPISGRLTGHSKDLEKISLYQEGFSDEVRAAVVQLAAEGKAKALLVTGSGVFTQQEYDDNDLRESGVPVLATVYSWKDADWWAAAPTGYVRRYQSYWRAVLRREYGEAVMPTRPAGMVPLARAQGQILKANRSLIGA